MRLRMTPADLIFDDEDVPLRAVDPPSATRFLEDFPEDPDEAVGWLEKMAHQDEPTSAAKAGALAAAKGIDPDDDDNADDMSAALAWCRADCQRQYGATDAAGTSAETVRRGR